MAVAVWMFVVGPLLVLYSSHRHYSEFGRWVDRLLDEHPTILIVGLLGSFLPSVLGGLMYRDFRKKYPALEAFCRGGIAGAAGERANYL
jgi:hypothetical protein